MIFVTGSAGFIGSYLTQALLGKGYEVRGIDIRPWRNGKATFAQITGSILDQDVVRNAMRGTDTIIHLAAEHKDFGISKEQYYRVNVDGTRILLEIATELNIKKFIFYSSVAVYGSRQPSFDETLPAPESYYGASKLQAETLIHEWLHRDPGRQVIIIRPTVVFGPRNMANIFRLVKQVCDGKFIWVGNGTNIKSVTYVENLVAATVFLLERMRQGEVILNYADEPHLTTRELVELVASKSDAKIPGWKLPESLVMHLANGLDILGDIWNIDFPITAARISKFNTATHHNAKKIYAMGFTPHYSVEQGVEKMVSWYLSNKNK